MSSLKIYLISAKTILILTYAISCFIFMGTICKCNRIAIHLQVETRTQSTRKYISTITTAIPRNIKKRKYDMPIEKIDSSYAWTVKYLKENAAGIYHRIGYRIFNYNNLSEWKGIK